MDLYIIIELRICQLATRRALTTQLLHTGIIIIGVKQLTVH